MTEDDAAFVKTAVAFEDLTAALLKWQAPRLDSRSIVAAVLTLHYALRDVGMGTPWSRAVRRRCAASARVTGPRATPAIE